MNCVLCKLTVLNLLAKKKKKPKLLNKFDKTIKAELDAAEKLRKKVSFRSFTQDCSGQKKMNKLKTLEKGKLILDYFLGNKLFEIFSVYLSLKFNFCWIVYLKFF